MQPPGVRPPPALRVNATIVSLAEPRTYTLAPSGLTTTLRAPPRPAVVPPPPRQSMPPICWMQPPGVSAPPASRVNAAIALLNCDATYTVVPSGLTATSVAPPSPDASPPTPSHEVPGGFWMQPPLMSWPLATRLNAEIAELSIDATYTL